MILLERLMVAGLVLVLAISIIEISQIDHINAWERVAGYPSGKLCDVFNSCK